MSTPYKWEDGSATSAGIITNWTGAWVTSKAYTLQDGASNDGSSYVCILAHTASSGSEPGVGANWTTYWDLVASKGDTGDTGAQGIKGDQGEKGDKGDIGTTGAQGIQGIQGVKGDKGDQGEPGIGDMIKTTYDPTNKNADAFSMDNMVETVTKKIMTATERTNLANQSNINSGDETASTLGSKINGATEKATPVDSDMIGLMDSAASNILKKFSWANIKATLKTYFDSLYTLANLGGVPTTRTVNGKALSANITLSLPSSDFANQGTATTVLHGNASGNPAFGAVVEADITLADNTTNNASASKHGFLPKLSGSATDALKGDGTWGTISGGVGDHGCKVCLSTSFNVGSGTAVNWDSEDFDTDTFHDNSTNSNRLTVPSAGKYLVHASIGISNNDTGTIVLRKNGTEVNRAYINCNNNYSKITNIHEIFSVSANDYFDIVVYTTSGSNYVTATQPRSIFEIIKLA